MKPLPKHLAALAASVLAACASSGASGTWNAQSWAAQTIRDVTSGPFGFSASPYGDDGFQFRISLKTGAFGIASADGAPDDAQLRDAAEAAAPDGCELRSVERTPDGGALADYDCD